MLLLLTIPKSSMVRPESLIEGWMSSFCYCCCGDHNFATIDHLLCVRQNFAAVLDSFSVNFIRNQTLISMGFASKGVWVMGYHGCMGYEALFPANQLGGLKNIWNLREYCSISFNSTGPVTCDRVVEILISATFGIHRDISFFFDQKPERNFFGEQCYCGCTSLVNKDRERINLPQYVALETVKYIFANVDRYLAQRCAASVDVSQNDDKKKVGFKI